METPYGEEESARYLGNDAQELEMVKAGVLEDLLHAHIQHRIRPCCLKSRQALL